MLITLQEAIDDIRAATNRDGEGDAGVSDSQLTTWINQEVEELRAALVRVAPDEWCTFGTFSLTSANTVLINSLAGSTGFLGIRSVEWDANSNASSRQWVQLREYQFGTRNRYARSWHVLGSPVSGQTLYIEPESPSGSVPGTYRLWLVLAPTEYAYPANAANTLDLPAVGGARYVCEGVAARVRTRLDEDPSFHLASKEASLKLTRAYYADRVLQQRAIEDVEGLVDDDGLGWT